MSTEFKSYAISVDPNFRGENVSSGTDQGTAKTSHAKELDMTLCHRDGSSMRHQSNKVHTGVAMSGHWFNQSINQSCLY